MRYLLSGGSACAGMLHCQKYSGRRRGDDLFLGATVQFVYKGIDDTKDVASLSSTRDLSGIDMFEVRFFGSDAKLVKRSITYSKKKKLMSIKALRMIFSLSETIKLQRTTKRYHCMNDVISFSHLT